MLRYSKSDRFLGRDSWSKVYRISLRKIRNPGDLDLEPLGRLVEQMLKKSSALRFSVSLAAAVFIATLQAIGDDSKSGSSSISFRQAVHDALEIASMNSNWEVMRGVGESMLPFFGNRSLLLVDRTSFSSLKVGMIAVYRDSDGDLVAHQIYSQEEGGFSAKGFNNSRSDSDLLTGENFLGTVFGVVTAPSGPGDDQAHAISRDLPLAYGNKH